MPKSGKQETAMRLRLRSKLVGAARCIACEDRNRCTITWKRGDVSNLPLAFKCRVLCKRRKAMVSPAA
eukprot:6466992-Amphidinium_carterae.1